MKVFQALDMAASGLATEVEFVGVCLMEMPRRPWLIVQQGEEIAEIYRLALHGGVAVVMLYPGQSPSHLPGFMSEADCVLAMIDLAKNPEPQYAET